jgi:hypothetical protein
LRGTLGAAQIGEKYLVGSLYGLVYASASRDRFLLFLFLMVVVFLALAWNAKNAI